MKAFYFDCFAGVSGDMVIGSLLDLGANFDNLKTQLSYLDIKGWNVTTSDVMKNGIRGMKFDVHLDDHDHTHRNLNDIISIIERTELSDTIKSDSIHIFEIIAEAEARVHGREISEVHFHEVGAVDSIIDIVGAAICFEELSPDRVISSSVNTGSGFTGSMHGTIPVPAPATIEILKGIPSYSSGIMSELATPTGVAILKYYCDEFGNMPVMTVDKTGYGAGSRDLDIPNLLRVTEGVPEEKVKRYIRDSVIKIEANIDDMNPEFYDYLMEKLFQMGALDVYIHNIHMKKNRPGTLLCVLAGTGDLDLFSDFIFRETTTAGLRYLPYNRYKLKSYNEIIQTGYGDVSVKILEDMEGVHTVSPEYEDCKRLAIEKNIPLRKVYDEAKYIALKKFS